MRLKILCALVGGLLASVSVLAPYGFGLRTEQTLTALVQLAEELWDIPIYTTAYHRGWWNATAETWLVLPPGTLETWRHTLPFLPPMTPASDHGLTLTHHILHGPLPFGARPSGVPSLRPVQTMLSSGLFPGAPGQARLGTPDAPLPLLQVHTTIGLFGGGQGHFAMPAFVQPPGPPEEATTVWEGLQGEVTVDAHGRHITGTVQAPGLALMWEDSRLALQHASAQVEVLTPRRQPARSTLTIRLGSLALTHRSAASASWAMTTASLQTTATTAHGLLQAHVTSQAHALRLGDGSYGPGTARLDIERLHLVALRDMLRGLHEASQDEPDMAAFWLRLVLSGDLAALLAGVVATSPALTLHELSLHTVDGDIRVKMQIHVDGSRLFPPGYLSQVLQTVEAEAAAEAPAAWVRAMVIAQVRRLIRAQSRFAALLPDSALNALAATMSDRQLHNLVEQGYLVLDGTTYKSQARYTQGQLLVQGKPVDLPIPGP